MTLSPIAFTSFVALAAGLVLAAAYPLIAIAAQIVA